MKKALATALVALAVTGTVSTSASADFSVNDFFADLQQKNGGN